MEDEVSPRLLHLALLAYNLPETFNFPWDDFDYLKKRAIERLASYTRHYYDWVDSLLIATYEGSLSITEAMLLALCPTEDLCKMIKSDDGDILIDGQAYDTPHSLPSRTLKHFGLAWGTDLGPVSRESTGCDFHLIDVGRDWWIAPLEKAAIPTSLEEASRDTETATYTAARDRLLEVFIKPLSVTSLKQLRGMITSKEASLFTVLHLLASNARGLGVKTLLMAGSVTERSDMSEEVQFPCVDEDDSHSLSIFLHSFFLDLKMTMSPSRNVEEVEQYSHELWRLLRDRRPSTGSVSMCDASEVIKILEIQLEAAQSVARILKLKIERTWSNSSPATMRYRLFLPSDLRAALLSRSASWESFEEEGFKPAFPGLTTSVNAGYHDLNTDAGPTRLIKMMNCGYLSVEALVWLMILWSQGGGKAERAISEYSVFPNLRLVVPPDRALESLRLISRFLRVDERQRWMAVCKDLREFLLSPEMEERAMIETLNLAPFGISRMLSGKVMLMKRRFLDRDLGDSFPQNLLRSYLTTWHAMGTYVHRLSPSELRPSDLWSYRVWLPLYDYFIVAERSWISETYHGCETFTGAQQCEAFRNSKLSGHPCTTPFEIGSLSLVAFAMKAFLSDADLRRRVLDVYDDPVLPFDVFDAGLKEGEECLWVSNKNAYFSTPVQPHERRQTRELILRNLKVFDIEPDQWWIPETEMTPELRETQGQSEVTTSSPCIDEADKLIKQGCGKIYRIQHRRLELWLNNQLNDMRHKSTGSVYKRPIAWDGSGIYGAEDLSEEAWDAVRPIKRQRYSTIGFRLVAHCGVSPELLHSAEVLHPAILSHGHINYYRPSLKEALRQSRENRLRQSKNVSRA